MYIDPTGHESLNTKTSLVDYLKSKKEGSSFEDRKELAKELGIKNYTGTAAQNTEMLNKLKAQDAKPAPAPTPTKPAPTKSAPAPTNTSQGSSIPGGHDPDDPRFSTNQVTGKATIANNNGVGDFRLAGDASNQKYLSGLPTNEKIKYILDKWLDSSPEKRYDRPAGADDVYLKLSWLDSKGVDITKLTIDQMDTINNDLSNEELAKALIGWGFIEGTMIYNSNSSIKEGTLNSSKSLLQAGTKADALKSIESLPKEVQSSVKSFFKGGSNAYTDFTVEQAANGNYMVKMTKPGNVPGSKAVYYKEIGADGSTIKVYKDTFDPAGNLVHTKDK